MFVIVAVSWKEILGYGCGDCAAHPEDGGHIGVRVVRKEAYSTFSVRMRRDKPKVQSCHFTQQERPDEMPP